MIIPYSVLAISALFQLYFRFFDLSFHGLWRDEIATMFFSAFPFSSISGDSHSFIYYLIVSPLSFFGSTNLYSFRLFHAVAGVLVLGLAIYRSRKLFTPAQWAFIFSLYGLHPVVFGMARLARPYGLLMDLSLLLIIECRRSDSRKMIFILATLLGLLHPVGLFVLIFEYVYSRHHEFRKIFAFAAAPSLIYYGIKVLFFQNQLTFVSWIKTDSLAFLKDLSGLFFGVFYPYYNNFPAFLGVWLLILILIFSLCVLIIKKDSFLWKESAFFFGIVLFIFISFNVLAFFQDLRISRYFVFLIPYFIIYLSCMFTRTNSWALPSTLVLMSLMFIQTVYYKPYFTPSVSFDSFVQEIKTSSESFNSPVLACGQRFHNWYFEKLGFESCENMETVRKFSRRTSPYIYAYMDKAFTPILFFGNDFKTLNLNLLPDGNVLVISNTHGAKNAESK